MKHNFIHIQIKDKNNIDFNEISELFKLSVGNNLIKLNYKSL